MSKPLIIIGNGGHASVLVETLILQKEEILGFTNPNFEENQFLLNYLGNDDVIYNYDPNEVELVLGLGMLKPDSIRSVIFTKFKKIGYKFKNIVHPTAIISPSVNIGEGVQIMAGVILQTNVIVADNTIINTGVIIDHNSKILSNVHVAPGCKISGNVTLNNNCFIGAGTTIINNVRVGESCLVGAGSLLIKSFPSGCTVLGVPAKVIKVKEG